MPDTDIRLLMDHYLRGEALPETEAERLGVVGVPTKTQIQSMFTGSPSYQEGQHPYPYQPQTFQPHTPQPELMSLEDMMDVVNRRTELATQPRIDALERSLEEQQLSGQQRAGAVQEAYMSSLDDLRKYQQSMQQQGARQMAARGIYDSGLAMDLSNRIASNAMNLGFELGQEQARVLADLAEYLDLQQRHTNEEIQGIMGEAALMAQTMLDEMHQQQQTRQDQLAQREFENWLAMQANELNRWRANMDEYWRQTEFDASRADQEWQQWFNQEQLRMAQEEAEWNRIFQMNRWEAEFELQQLLANNQITQQEFQNALALDEFNLKVKMFEYEQRNKQATQFGGHIPPQYASNMAMAGYTQQPNYIYNPGMSTSWNDWAASSDSRRFW